MTCDVEVLHPGQFTQGVKNVQECREMLYDFVQQQNQYLKYSVFAVVLLSMGNCYTASFHFFGFAAVKYIMM